MATLDPIFGTHAAALSIQAKRMELLSANIANADTPAYQARDIDFAKVLSSTQSTSAARRGSEASAVASDPRHIPIAAFGDSGSGALDASYRVPVQPSADGNTVDVQVEQGKFADAALRYQASLSFASANVKDLMSAFAAQ